MKGRRLLCLLVALGCLLGLSGCPSLSRFLGYESPAADETARWVCEDPEMWFTFVPDEGHRGELVLDGETIPVDVCFDYGDGVDVFPSGAVDANTRIFTGDCRFGRGGYSDFTVTVREDQPHPFGEDPPVFEFVCQRKQEDGTWK